MCYDNEAFNSETTRGDQARSMYSPSDGKFPECAVVGYSQTAEGPVMAKSPRKGKSSKDNPGSAEGDQTLRDQNSFKPYKVIPFMETKVHSVA
jgi:hypothetical protein